MDFVEEVEPKAEAKRNQRHMQRVGRGRRDVEAEVEAEAEAEVEAEYELHSPLHRLPDRFDPPASMTAYNRD